MARNCVGFIGGMGGNRTGIGEYMRRLDAAGIPFSIKASDDAGLAFEAQQLAGESGVPHVIVYRRAGDIWDVPDYDKSPEAAALEHWQKHLDAWPPELEKSIVWWETVNEVDKGRSDWLGEFAYHTAKLALDTGRKWAAFGWSSGEPEREHWRGGGMEAFLRLCSEHPGRLAVALHEYSYEVGDITAGYPDKIGRFQRLFEACDVMGIARPTVLITEWGWEYQNVPEPQQAIGDIGWAAQLYAQYPQILGAFLWTLGGGEEFGNIANQAQRLIAPVTEMTLSEHFPGPVVQPPEPGPGPAFGGPRVPYARVYWFVPHLVDVAKRRQIYLRAADRNITVGPSADDAGIGALEDKTAVLHCIPAEGRQIFVDWFRDHYPKTRVEFDSEVPEPFSLALPVDPPPIVTQRFGANSERYSQWGLPGHEGIDLAAALGSPVRACHDGVVYRVHLKDDNPYGIHVRVLHALPDGRRFKTVSAHLKSAAVQVGDIVVRGQIIGFVGLTGRTTGPHVHVTLKLEGATARGETNYPGDQIDPEPFLDMDGATMPDPDPEPSPPPASGFNDWAPGRFLAGVHGRADGGEPRSADYEAVRLARLPAVKLMSSAWPDNVEAAADSGAEFIMVRLFVSFDNDRVVSADDFVSWLIPDIERFYDRGIRYFEVHNEPNLRREGFGSSWQDGAGFGFWFLMVGAQLKERFPEIRLGFPGCSPGGDIGGGDGKLLRRDQWQFVEAAAGAVDAADWIGVHGYWRNRAEMLDEVHGQGWKLFARRWPGKLLLITEFGNAMPRVSPHEKGQQYREFYTLLAEQRSVGAAFAYVVSGSGWAGWAWVHEDGNLTDIPAVVGGR